VNPQVETLYQEVGRQALAEAPDAAGRLLIYAEVEDGVASADMFYVRSSKSPIKFRFCSRQLRELVVSLWESWKRLGKPEWRAMSYVTENGKFNIDLTYPDQLNEEEDLADRRPRIVQKYFGDAPIDYSSPKA
jgi:hypothetical protein